MPIPWHRRRILRQSARAPENEAAPSAVAIADFGGAVLGNTIELLTADHQNKPELGAEKFREWADREGVTMVLGGSNSAVNLAISAIAKEPSCPAAMASPPILLRSHSRGGRTWVLRGGTSGPVQGVLSHGSFI